MIKTPTLSEIYSNMRADAQVLMGADAPIPALSLLNVLLVVFAGAIKLLYGHLGNVARWILPDKAQGRFLSRLLDVYQIPISIGSAAEGEVVCFGNVGTVVPLGSKFIQIDGTSYISLEEAVVGVDGNTPRILIQAETIGTSGNYTGTALTMPSPPPHIVATANLVSRCVGGAGADTEVDSRNKLLLKIRTPVTMGLATDYERIALAVDGVGKAWVKGGEHWTGPNTTNVTIATRDNTPVSSTVLNNVISTFSTNDKLQPGIIVGVMNLDETLVHISVKITPNTPNYQANVHTTINALFRDSIVPGETLKISSVRSAIKASGVEDYQISTISTTLPDGLWDGSSNLVPLVHKKFGFGGLTFV